MRHASRRASQSLGQAADRVRHVALLLSNAAVITEGQRAILGEVARRRLIVGVADAAHPQLTLTRYLSDDFTTPERARGGYLWN